MDKRKKLHRILKMCTKPQQEVFARMYKNVDSVKNCDLDWAIKQCERTVANNTEGKLRIGHVDPEDFFDENY